jgi:hypothetical protein
MPQLTNVRVRPTLTNLSLSYANQEFIADKIFPIVSRDTMTGEYYVSGMEMFTRESDIRGIKDRANAVDHDYRKQSYSAMEHSLLEEIPAVLIEEARASGVANVLKLEADASNIVTQKLALGREIDFATQLRNTASYAAGNSTTLAGTAQFSDFTNSDPAAAIDGYQEVIRSKIGKRGNLGIFSRPVFRKLRAHPKMKTEAGQKDGGSLSEEQVADVLELDRILVPASIQNTVAPNVTDSFTAGDVWGKDMMLLQVADSAGLGTLSFGFLFRVTYPNTNLLAETRTWDEEDRRLRVVEGNFQEDRHIAMPEAGYLVKSAVA